MVFCGNSRLFFETNDLAVEMLDRIAAAGHHICAVIVSQDDPITGALSQRNIKTVIRPEFLNGNKTQIKQNLFRPEFTEWLTTLRLYQPDCGISFYSDWIPPAIYKIPAHGTVNIHPAPLPKFTGYEPELFHVLYDQRRSAGTIHYVEEKIDTGNILAYGNEVELPEDMTPTDVYTALIRGCFPPLIDVLDKIATGTEISYKLQKEQERSYATKKLAAVESVIQWQTDSHRKMDCRLRAFNSTNDGNILKALINGQLYQVFDILFDTGNYSGLAGEKIGIYTQEGEFYHAPILCTLEGIAILRLGSLCQISDNFMYDNNNNNMFLLQKQRKKIADKQYIQLDR
jgi:methionyl-tRNA formyltransferase